MVTMYQANRLARKRLSVLRLAEQLGSVSDACRRSGMDRTSFYVWKKRFEESGLEGLKNISTAHLYHPQTTSREDEEKILELSLSHPGWGCDRLSDRLRLQGAGVSSPTVQRILIKHNMGSKFDRLLRLEEKHIKEGFMLTDDQIRLIERMNPVFTERNAESSRPGELLCQDSRLAGTIPGTGRVYLHWVVDTYSSFAFVSLHTSRQARAAVALLRNKVIPQYGGWNLSVENILTSSGREFCGADDHPYERFLRLNDIGHRITHARHPCINGFAERFNRTVKEEFIAAVFRKKLYVSIEEHQRDLDDWIGQYNYERPHTGYRNLGKRPFDTKKSHIRKSKKRGGHPD